MATKTSKKTTKKPAGKRTAKPAPKAPTAAREKRPAKAPKDKPTRQGALTAAARFLAEAKEPVSVGDITTAILERGWWKTNGQTPSATLYAAIHREIESKGKASRFEKVDRGRFTLRNGA